MSATNFLNDAGQFGRVIGYIEPLPEGNDSKYEFENALIGNAIPPEFHTAIERGFKEAANSGALIGAPVEVRSSKHHRSCMSAVLYNAHTTLSSAVSGCGCYEHVTAMPCHG